MRKQTQNTINQLHGRDFNSGTYNTTIVKQGKFRTKFTSITRSATISKTGEVLSTRDINSSSSSLNVTSGIIGSTLGVIMGALLLINMFNLLMGNTEFRGFEWFLNVLSNAPEIPIDWLNTWTEISKIDAESWGVFAFLANWANFFTGIFNTIIFVGIGALNIITFIVYFIGEFIFLGI